MQCQEFHCQIFQQPSTQISIQKFLTDDFQPRKQTTSLLTELNRQRLAFQQGWNL